MHFEEIAMEILEEAGLLAQRAAEGVECVCDRGQALSKGKDGFVPKPVEMNKLFETLAGIIM